MYKQLNVSCSRLSPAFELPSLLNQLHGLDCDSKARSADTLGHRVFMCIKLRPSLFNPDTNAHPHLGESDSVCVL